MEQKNYKAETNNIIALCHIIDEFEEFEKRLIPVISQKYNRDFVFQLWDISKGKFKLGARKAKKFYSENKEIIDTINKYSNITRFINDNYGWYGEPEGNLQFFYQYISSHKEEMEQILAVLEKLKELRFRKFEFNENLNFTKEIYGAYPSFDRNWNFIYVANPQVIPNYESHINFKTTDSNYKMKLELDGITGKEISYYGRYIVLNSLVFDPNTFPIKVDRENTHGQLVNQKNEQKNMLSTLRNSVDLSISISDLEQQFNHSNEIINKLDGVKNKEELVATLLSIKEYLEKLKTLGAEYDSNVSQEEPSLTPEVLEREKSLYLERRVYDSMHLY